METLFHKERLLKVEIFLKVLEDEIRTGSKPFYGFVY